MRYEGLPFWFALFIGNVVSVLLLSRLVPWFGKLLRWWLIPDGRRDWRRDVASAGLMLGIYTACLLVFSQVPGRRSRRDCHTRFEPSAGSALNRRACPLCRYSAARERH